MAKQEDIIFEIQFYLPQGNEVTQSGEKSTREFIDSFRLFNLSNLVEKARSYGLGDEPTVVQAAGLVVEKKALIESFLSKNSLFKTH